MIISAARAAELQSNVVVLLFAMLDASPGARHEDADRNAVRHSSTRAAMP